MSWNARDSKIRVKNKTYETVDEFLARGGKMQKLKSFKGIEGIQYYRPGPHLVSGFVPGCYFPKCFGNGNSHIS